MLKELQSITARSEVWVIVVAAALVEIVAAPARTTPELGPARAPPSDAIAVATATLTVTVTRRSRFCSRTRAIPG